MELIKNAWRSIFRQPSRSLLTILSIAIGVFSILLIGTISDLGEDAVQSELESLGMQGLTLRADPESGCRLSEGDLEWVRDSPGVAEATPLSYRFTRIAARGHRIKAMVWGIDANICKMISLKLIYGREISREDIISGNRVCLAEQSFVREMYQRDNAVGKTLRVQTGGRDETFTIIGVVEAGGSVFQSLMGGTVPMFLYLPYTALQDCTGRSGFDRIAVKPAEGNAAAQLGASLDRELENRLGKPGSVTVDDFSRYAGQFSGVMSTVSLILSLIAGISLIVAGLSIMTVMLASVGERTREIGIKKSIGANEAVIIQEFLLEAVFLSLLGSLIGAAAGIAAGWAGCLLLGIPYSLRPGLAAGCIGCAVLIGTVFGAYPAKKAAALKPVEALRRE